MSVNNNGSSQSSEQNLDNTVPSDLVAQRTEARIEAVKLLNNSDSLPVFQESGVQNPDDPIAPLGLTDHGHVVAANEHYVHHAGHGHGHHPANETSDTTVASGIDSTTGRPSLVEEALNNPAMEVQLAAENPALAEQLAASNPALAAQLAASNPALAAQLAASNPALAAQLAASNPALAAQLAAQNPGLAVELAMQNPALAAQLAASNPALAAQLAAQNPDVEQTEV